MATRERGEVSASRKRRILARAKKRHEQKRRDVRRRAVQEAAFVRGPYSGARTLLEFLKLAVLLLTGLLVLTTLVVTVWLSSKVDADRSLLVLWYGLLEIGFILLGAAFVYLVLLAIGAVFDNADHNRESLEVEREMLAEMQVSSESLSEIAESQSDDEEGDDEGGHEGDDEGDESGGAGGAAPADPEGEEG